jgi:hypothetical protein
MELSEIEELKTKVSPLTIGFIILAVAFGSVLGYNYAEIASQSNRLEMLHGFALDEVGGVRADMDKEDKVLRKEIDILREEIKELQKK